MSDLFNQTWEDNLEVAPGQVHIRVQQRNARQKISTVEGLSPHLNFEKIAKVLKKQLCCNAKIIDDPLLGKIIQFQGDQRREIADFIIRENLVSSADMVKIHG